jgi:hypothetical protein
MRCDSLGQCPQGGGIELVWAYPHAAACFTVCVVLIALVIGHWIWRETTKEDDA